MYRPEESCSVAIRKKTSAEKNRYMGFLQHKARRFLENALLEPSESGILSPKKVSLPRYMDGRPWHCRIDPLLSKVSPVI